MRDLMDLANEIGKGISGAVFSADRLYRYALWRIWDKSLAALLFAGLNSSTAADVRDDPTVVRMVGFGKSWGFGGVYFANLYPNVTPDPRKLFAAIPPEHVIAKNDEAIRIMKNLTAKTMVGWGNEGRNAGTRPGEVLALLGEPVYCLGTTEGKQPRHPLYQLRDAKLREYSAT